MQGKKKLTAPHRRLQQFLMSYFLLLQKVPNPPELLFRDFRELPQDFPYETSTDHTCKYRNTSMLTEAALAYCNGRVCIWSCTDHGGLGSPAPTLTMVRSSAGSGSPTAAALHLSSGE